MDKKRGKILVLDDEKIVLESVSRILEDEQYDVKTCQSGKEALAALKEYGFDLLITDLKMPGLDGIETIKLCSGHDPDLSVIIITAYPTVDSAVGAMKLGALDYIRKPFTPDQLTESVENAITNRRSRVEKKSREETFDAVKAAISSTLNLKRVLNCAADGLTRLLGVKGGTVSLLDGKTRELRILAFSGLSEDYVNKGPVDSAKSISETLTEKKTSFVADVASDPRVQYPKEAIREGVKTILSVPMIVKERAVGVLRAYSEDARQYSGEEIKCIERLADLTALCVQNAKSYEDVKDEYDTLRDDLWDSFDKVGWE
jgi:YesN/AraC family two-component response regulator